MSSIWIPLGIVAIVGSVGIVLLLTIAGALIWLARRSGGKKQQQ
jgi:hypothetical protein